MIDESKIIFYTGCPGSKWSAISNLLVHNEKWPVNSSDYSKEREYTHPRGLFRKTQHHPNHQGAYWGPGNPWGQRFHELDKLSKNEVISEIEKPYKDKSWEKYRIIKCHQFALNLDWIKENFPQSPIIIVVRDPTDCFSAWKEYGHWDNITYPNYKYYYKSDALLKAGMEKESLCTKKFIKKMDVDMYKITLQHWADFWKIFPDTKEKIRDMTNVISAAWPNTIEPRQLQVWGVHLAIYNLKEPS